MKTFSRLSLLTLLFLGIALMLVGNTVYAQSLEVFTDRGQSGFPYYIGDVVQVAFVVDPPDKAVILTVTAPGVHITGISGATPPYTIPGNYATDTTFGTLIVQGIIVSSGAYIAARWDRGAADDLSALADLVVVASPDLVVEAVQAEPSTVAAGEQFRLSATLKNNGVGESTATTVRYYRSTDAVISTEDTQLRSANRDPLAAGGTIRRYLTVTAPTTPGTYSYGVCVDSVTDESDTANNCSMAVSVTVTAPPVVSEDVNDDGVVDVQDLVSVAERYGQTGTTTADVNEDGVVNIDDLILVAAVLDAAAAAAPSLYPNALEMLTAADVKEWLSQAHQRDLTDPSVRRGILFLEQLLTSMVSKETALLSNYPNPFNPETWIPYHLSKDADVTLHIYGVDGLVVRTLALGHQPSGIYQSRSRAAYWDGRNTLGEPVASGVYFYTLTAGEFSATRKMLIRK